MLPEPKSAEERREHRRRVLKGATILTGMQNSALSCTIRNLHQHGAEIRIDADVPVPGHFLLYVPSEGIGYRATLAWRKGDRAGLRFDGTEPKPSWHYG